MITNEQRQALAAALRRDFHFSCPILRNQAGDYTLQPKAIWTNGTENVDHIHMRIVGVHPLTGQPLALDRLSMDFYPGNTERGIGPFAYDGKFRIVFTVILTSQETVDGCIDDYTFELSNTNTRPYIKFRKSSPPRYRFFQHDFSEITIESNCWPRCRGKLWIKINERFLPVQVEQAQLTSGTYAKLSWRLAADSAAVIRLIAAPELPSPVEVK